MNPFLRCSTSYRGYPHTILRCSTLWNTEPRLFEFSHTHTDPYRPIKIHIHDKCCNDTVTNWRDIMITCRTWKCHVWSVNFMTTFFCTFKIRIYFLYGNFHDGTLQNHVSVSYIFAQIGMYKFVLKIQDVHLQTSIVTWRSIEFMNHKRCCSVDVMWCIHFKSSR